MTISLTASTNGFYVFMSMSISFETLTAPTKGGHRHDDMTSGRFQPPLISKSLRIMQVRTGTTNQGPQNNGDFSWFMSFYVYVTKLTVVSTDVSFLYACNHLVFQGFSWMSLGLTWFKTNPNFPGKSLNIIPHQSVNI